MHAKKYTLEQVGWLVQLRHKEPLACKSSCCMYVSKSPVCLVSNLDSMQQCDEFECEERCQGTYMLSGMKMCQMHECLIHTNCMSSINRPVWSISNLILISCMCCSSRRLPIVSNMQHWPFWGIDHFQNIIS
jgi:hypothetical protein